MTDRTLKAYHGEDLSPVYDLTELNIWERAEFGTRAWMGESINTNLALRDEQSETSHQANLPGGLTPYEYQARNVFEAAIGTSVLWRGRVANQSYLRGVQKSGRARETTIYLEDVNIDLRWIVVHGWDRPAETDVQRALALAAAYLDGSPAATTIVSTSGVVDDNTVDLPAKTYNQTTVQAIMEELALLAGKKFFLRPRTSTSDAFYSILYYDLSDAVIDTCPFSISDHVDEVDYSSVFEPIWDMGAAGELTAQETLSGVWLFYGQDQYVHVADSGISDITGHAETVLFDDSVTTEAEAIAKATAMIEYRRSSERRINVSIGPLTDTQVLQIKPGQRITIQAMAVPWADDQTYDADIGQLTLTTDLPGRWYAHLQLDRPMRMGAYGSGDKASVTKPDLCHDQPGVEASECTDTFTRTVASGWGDTEITEPGTATSWQPYNSGVLSVDGSVGVIDFTASGIRGASLVLPDTYVLEVTGQFTIATFGGTNGTMLGDVTLYLANGLPGLSNEKFSIGVFWASTAIDGTSSSSQLFATAVTDDFPDGFTESSQWTVSDPITTVVGVEYTESVSFRMRIDVSGAFANAWQGSEGSYQASMTAPAGNLRDFVVSKHPLSTVTFDNFQLVEPCTAGVAGTTCTTGGSGATSGDSDEAAPADHDHDYVATGGTTGQHLAKASNADYDTEWVDADSATADAHIADSVDAHDASAISFTPAGTIAATDVQAAIEEVAAEAGSGSLTVEDEGTPLATAATSLDFVGAGVVASGTGATKTITISGASVADILDLPTAETDDALVLAPDGAGGVEFRAETGGGGITNYVPRAAMFMWLGGATTTAALGNNALAEPIVLAGPMLLRRFSARVSTGGSGTVQWGLFDISNPAVGVKLAGGSGALSSTGVQSIDATSAPVLVPAGIYMLVVDGPAANAPAYNTSNAPLAALGFARTWTSYTWTDSPDFTLQAAGQWENNGAQPHWWLVGDLDGSGTIW